jgi:integrase
MKFTVKSIAGQKLPTGKTEAIVFDDDVPGFGLRIREGGSRNFIFQYKIGKKHRRLTLGPLTALDLTKARDTAKDLYAKVRLGADPAGEKAHAKIKADETFDVVVARYLEERREELRPLSYREIERHLLDHAKPLHRLQLAKIARKDIASCIGAVRKNSGAVTGNRVRASLSAMFTWAMGEGLLDTNPVIGTKRSDEKARTRVLQPAELRSIWAALPEGHYGTIMKLLALTGQRAGEIAGLRWSELCEIEIETVSEKDGLRSFKVNEIGRAPPDKIAAMRWSEVRETGARWPKLRGLAIIFPKERVKNATRHMVPISEPVREILAELAKQPRRVDINGSMRDHLFGHAQGPFDGWSNCKERLDDRLTERGVKLEPWTTHDLRRSFSTHAANLGIPPHIVETILNHRSGHKGGIAGTYNYATYSNEVRRALDTWARHLLAWVEGAESNVVDMPQPA